MPAQLSDARQPRQFVRHWPRQSAPTFVGPEKGGETIIYLASWPKIAAPTGRYFYKCRPIASSRAAQDDRTALALWERRAALAGLNA